MIKANELRIGNWYLFDDDPTKFSFQTIKDLEFDNSYIGEPLPLTPEILEKAGFVKRRYGIGSSDQTYKLLMPKRTPDAYPHIQIIADEAWLIIHGYCFASSPCKYLHQLQNLYFALTDEELNIEL